MNDTALIKPEVEVLPPGVVVAPSLSADFGQARVYRDGLRAMGQGAAVMAVLLGTELTRLHKLHGVRAGRPSVNSRNVSGIKWPELLKRELDISEDSARNYMALADQARKRIPEFRPIAEELLSTPLGQLPEVRRAALAEETRHLLPSGSAQQLAWDWGTTKRPAPRGGDTTTPGQTPAKSSKADQAQAFYYELQEQLFRGIAPGTVKLMAHLPATTAEPDKEAALGTMIDFARTLLAALEDAQKIVRGRAD